MSARILIIGAIAFAGIIAPFVAAWRILNLFYAPDTAGTPMPVFAVAVAYLTALLLATLVFYLASKAMRGINAPPLPDDDVETEDLPE